MTKNFNTAVKSPLALALWRLFKAGVAAGISAAIAVGVDAAANPDPAIPAVIALSGTPLLLALQKWWQQVSRQGTRA